MHYNQFTIDYIEAIKEHLHIVLNDNNEAWAIPETVTIENISSLHDRLKEVWNKSDSAIEIIKSRHDSAIQSGLFGPVNELDFALKVGFLQSDRIVLIDYLLSRFLSRKDPGKINKDHLCALGNSLVELLPLAKKGRVVIIPNPFIWNPNTKKTIEEASQNSELTAPFISMLNMLSICKECKLHPYTITESESLYNQIVNNQIDHVNMIGTDGGKYAYEGILCGLLSEKLLNNVELSYMKDFPLIRYPDIISQHQGFYSEYISKITTGGSLNAENNINSIRKSFSTTIDKGNLNLSNFAANLTKVSGIGAAGIAVLGTTSVISAPLAITGAALALSASLGSLIKQNAVEENTIISLFKKFK